MEDVLCRLWDNLAGRINGPMSVRFILQPAAAAVLAIRAGLMDSRTGRLPYLSGIISDPQNRGALLRGGCRDVARVFVLAVLIDVVYQLVMFNWFYPLESLILASVVAPVPYLLLRGLANRIARRWSADSE